MTRAGGGDDPKFRFLTLTHYIIKFAILMVLYDTVVVHEGLNLVLIVPPELRSRSYPHVQRRAHYRIAEKSMTRRIDRRREPLASLP